MSRMVRESSTVKIVILIGAVLQSLSVRIDSDELEIFDHARRAIDDR